jgi:hypothetical protein
MDRLESKEVVVWLKPGCDYMIYRKDFSTHCRTDAVDLFTSEQSSCVCNVKLKWDYSHKKEETRLFVPPLFVSVTLKL